MKGKCENAYFNLILIVQMHLEQTARLRSGLIFAAVMSSVSESMMINHTGCLKGE